MQLTVTDFVKEIHDTHHPLGGELYYEDAKPEAKRFTENFLKSRVPKYLGYFEDVLEKSGGPFVLGRKFSYIDLSLFQLIDGLRYAFPKAMKRIERKVPGVVAVHAKLRRARASRPIWRRSAGWRSTSGVSSGITRNWMSELFIPSREAGRDQTYAAAGSGFLPVSRQSRNSPEPTTMAEPASNGNVGMSPQNRKPSPIAQTSEK